MRILMIIFLAGLFHGTTLVAQPAATQPAGDKNLPRRPLPRETADSQEVEEVEKFMKENTPRRWESFDKIARESPVRKRILRMVAARYRNLQATLEEDKTLYDLQFQMLKVEDDMFGLVEGPGSRESKRAELKVKAAELVDLTFKERARRIERLEKRLQEEKERLGRDKERRDGEIEQMVDRVIRNGPLGIRPPEGKKPPRAGSGSD